MPGVEVIVLEPEWHPRRASLVSRETKESIGDIEIKRLHDDD
jgi:hypothetical protein